jgi:hypothetical protein
LKEVYECKYETRYNLDLDFQPFRLARPHLRMAFAMLFRSQRGYRWVDRLLLIRLLSLLSPLLPLRRHGAAGNRLTDQAMGIRAVFK